MSCLAAALLSTVSVFTSIFNLINVFPFSGASFIITDLRTGGGSSFENLVENHHNSSTIAASLSFLLSLLASVVSSSALTDLLFPLSSPLFLSLPLVFRLTCSSRYASSR